MSPLTVIFLVVFLDLVGVGILIPVFPFLVRQFQGGAFTVGLMAFSFSAAQFAAAPILGVLSDRYGRRPVLLLSLFGTAIGYFLFGWAPALWVMYLSRVIDGITGGNISTAQAYIADISAPEDRAKNFGLIGAAFGLGFIIGPTLGGLFAKISLAAPAFAAGVFSLFTLLAAWLFLPESLGPSKRHTGRFPWMDFNPFRQIFVYVARPSLTAPFAAWCLMTFAMGGLQSNFAVFSSDRHQLGPGANAAIFAGIGAVGVFTQGYLIRRLSNRIEPARLVTIGMALATLGFLGIAVSPAPWALYPSTMSVALGVGLASPSISGMLSKRAAAAEQGAVLGVSQSLASLSRGIGPVWAGALYERAGWASPYWSGALWLVVASVAITRSSREASTPSSRAVPSSR